MNETQPFNEQEQPPQPNEETNESSGDGISGSRLGKFKRAIASDPTNKIGTSATNTSASSTNLSQEVASSPANQVPQYQSRPLKDRNMALVLEILPGLFGLYGFGWIYSGNSGLGITLLIGGIIWAIIVVVAAVLTASAACFCTVPVNIVAVALSAISLNNYTKSHPELFG